MTTEIKKEKEKTNAAYIAARDALVKELGKEGTNERFLDVVLLMAYQLLTDGGALARAVANHNAEFFCDQLKNLVESSQKDVKASSYCGRLM